jgi:hypothetical protein
MVAIHLLTSTIIASQNSFAIVKGADLRTLRDSFFTTLEESQTSLTSKSGLYRMNISIARHSSPDEAQKSVVAPQVPHVVDWSKLISLKGYQKCRLTDTHVKRFPRSTIIYAAKDSHVITVDITPARLGDKNVNVIYTTAINDQYSVWVEKAMPILFDKLAKMDFRTIKFKSLS